MNRVGGLCRGAWCGGGLLPARSLVGASELVVDVVPRGVVTVLFLVVLVGGQLQAQGAPQPVEGYRFILPEITAVPGEKAILSIDGLYEQSVQGFSLAARYPSASLTIESIHFEQTILEAIGTDFFEAVINPSGGFFTVGVLVDAKPPFDGELIPNINRPLTFLHVEARVAAGATEDLVIRLENGLSRPPISNIYVVDNKGMPVSELTAGVIRVAQGVKAFLRGDVNLDARVDIADPVRILGFSFNGGRPLPCLDAADGNDDGRVDISDSIFLLYYLFLAGPVPPPPVGKPGPDPTEDLQGCDQPLVFLPV